MLRRLVRSAPDHGPPHVGSATVLDGLSAVAATEARLCESAAIAASFPASIGARVWDQRTAQDDVNQFGELLGSITSDSPRAALSAALGLSMSGERACVFCSGPDLIAAQDLLLIAAGQHLPLVIHLANRAPTGHAQALGTGHETYHSVSDSGCFQLFAMNVQEAVDLALIARRTAERALIPGILAMDAEHTALAAQDVCLPDDELIDAYLGQPSQRIKAPTEAQRMIFGENRRLVPRQHNLDRPAMLGPLQGPEAWALGAAGQRPYFYEHLSDILDESFNEFAALTGRRYNGVFAHQLDNADMILIVQGSAVETATAIADHVRKTDGRKLGVLGLRCLRPLPAAPLVQHLSGAKVVAVLERVDTPLSDGGPLLRELRGVLAHARENERFPVKTHPDLPTIRDSDVPRLVSVPFGLGGLPVHAADLVALVGALESADRSQIYLGLEFVRSQSLYPKHQAVMDALRRSYGDLETLSLRSSEPPPDIRPPRATTIAVHRLAGREFESLAGDATALIHTAVGGGVRCRPGITWQRFDQPCTDFITHASPPLLDPGDDPPVDIAITAVRQVHQHMRLTERLTADGALLMASCLPDEEVIASLPAQVRQDLLADGRALFIVPVPTDDEADYAGPSLRAEALLGALLAVFLDRVHNKSFTQAKVRTLREAALSHLPEQHRVRHLDAFITGFESLHTVDIESSVLTGDEHAKVEPEAPAAVRQLRSSTDTVDSLARFWDQAGVFYHTGEIEELAANPCHAVGAVPRLSSAFRDVSAARRSLPVFEPATCDGDPRLWTSCPDGSIAPLVISARALIDAGLELVSATGKRADALRAIAGKLAKRVNKIVAADENPPALAGELLRCAFNELLAKMDAGEERGAALEEAIKLVVGQLGELRVAKTRVFFDEPERESRGTGELFTLVVNPDACKSPEVVLAACAGRGLSAVQQTQQALESARRLWDLWHQLPDTTGATIERARKHPEIGSLAAVMLSRHCLQAMAGGDGAEAGSGAKLALRHVLGLTEFFLQPRQQKYLNEIDSMRSQLAERIHEVLGEALPSSDLDALAEGLDLLGRGDLELAQLSEKIGSAMTAGRVDGAQLGRLVDVARRLADLHWHLASGPDGLGRARAGLTIAPGSVASWAGAYPYNPFQGPVVIDAGGETGLLARGLLEGQLRQVLAGFRLMRWAHLELNKPNEAAHAARELAALRFKDLTEDERQLCPPMIVIGDGQALGSRGLSQLTWLLKSDLPVKTIVLGDIGGTADGGLAVDAMGNYPAGECFDLALLALLTRRAFVVQTSIANPEHFAHGVLSALAYDGPALIHIHAPSPERHGFPVDCLHRQANLSVKTRAFPLMVFDPSREGVFGSCLDLSGNPDAESRWVRDENGRAMTPVEWAVTEQRFAEHCQPLEKNASAPTPIAEYLDASPTERAGQTPYVIVGTREGEQRLRVGEALIADAQERLRIWRILQELAGVVTPFTKKVREDAERDLANEHETQISELKKMYEARIAHLKAEFEAEATQRVTSGLMALAGYGAPDAPNGDTAP